MSRTDDRPQKEEKQNGCLKIGSVFCGAVCGKRMPPVTQRAESKKIKKRY